MNTIKLTEQEVREVIDLDDYETIKESGGKHDCTNHTILFKKDGKHYTMVLSFSYNEGLQLWGDVTATEVHQIEKVIKVWEPV